jgi:hypothetical protein
MCAAIPNRACYANGGGIMRTIIALSTLVIVVTVWKLGNLIHPGVVSWSLPNDICGFLFFTLVMAILGDVLALRKSEK